MGRNLRASLRPNQFHFTGLPPRLRGWQDFDRHVATLASLGIVEDASRIWRDLRPAAKFPTLETRICDASPCLEDRITLAALIQATTRMLWRLSRRHCRWRACDDLLLAENRWRAARYGTTAGLVDFGAGQIRPFPQLAEDAHALNSRHAVARLGGMVRDGGSAERQRAVLAAALAAGASRPEALCGVVMHLVEEFRRDL